MHWLLEKYSEYLQVRAISDIYTKFIITYLHSHEKSIYIGIQLIILYLKQYCPVKTFDQ